jgi:hypothetical protein
MFDTICEVEKNRGGYQASHCGFDGFNKQNVRSNLLVERRDEKETTCILCGMNRNDIGNGDEVWSGGVCVLVMSDMS